jgi:hypothetical protein
MKAMRAAIEQREAITPEFLRVLKSVAAAPAEWAGRKDNMLPVFATGDLPCVGPFWLWSSN